MAIRFVTQVDGQDFEVTLSRDEAGNYVAEAACPAQLERADADASTTARVRVVDSAKERALHSLLVSLHRLACGRPDSPHEGPETPAAA